MANTKTFGTMDLYVSAFLSLHNLEPTLEERNGKIIFTFEATDNLYQLMSKFNSNEDVPVADYTTAVKTLRGKMLTAKESINGYGNGDRHGAKKNW